LSGSEAMPLPLVDPQTQRPSIRRIASSPPVWRRQDPVAAEAALEFGRFEVLLRRRELLADGTPVELGTRAFDLLLTLLEADGALVTKSDLLSRVWPGIVVGEDNLKVQISALRRALGKDRDVIRTEFGRGYRFTAAVRSIEASSACQHIPRHRRQPHRRPLARSTPVRSFHSW
jgi:DNA-binding winged helix-turn-helix (wHTH) protein